MIKVKTGFTLTTREGWLLSIYSHMLMLIVALPAFAQSMPPRQFPPRRTQQYPEPYTSKPAPSSAPYSAGTGLAGIGLSLITVTTPDGSSSFKIPGLCPVQRYGHFCGFPGKPPMKAELNRLKNGSTSKSYTWTAGADDIGMNVIYGVFPFVVAQATDATLRIRMMQEDSAEIVRRGGRVIASNQVSVQGYPGHQIVACCEALQGNSFSSFSRSVFAENRIFTFTVSVLDQDVGRFKNDINEFLNSLVIRK